jgi:hypothetical protein
VAPLNRPHWSVETRLTLTGEVLDGDRQIGRRKLLAKLRRERIELGGKVIGYRTGVVAAMAEVNT